MASRNLLYTIKINTQEFMRKATAAFDALKRKFQESLGSMFSDTKFGDMQVLNIGLASALKELTEGLKEAQSVGDVGATFSRVGVSVTRTLVRFLGPMGKIVLVSTAAAAALVKFTEQFRDLEKAAYRVNMAHNRRSGKMASTRGDRVMERAMAHGNTLALSGHVDLNDFADAIANARASHQSIDERSFETMALNAAHFGALTGRNPEELIRDLAPILDDVSVSFEQLKDIGVDLTRQEINQVNALKSTGKQAEANAIILKRLSHASHGLGAVFEDTLSGEMKRFVNILQHIVVDVGRMVAGPLKILFKVINGLATILGLLVNTIGNLVESLQRKVEEAWNWFIGNGTYANYKDVKMRRETDNYVDPRLQISAQFESMDSMTKRIQASIVSKNSPGERQVGLLQDILRQVEQIHGADRKRQETADQQSAYLHDMNRGIQGFQGGLA